MFIIFISGAIEAVDLLKVSLRNSVSIFHIAPVAGSIINIPKTPPKSKFPKYQPSNLKVIGTILSS